MGPWLTAPDSTGSRARLPASAADTDASLARRWYVLVVLTLVYTLNIADRYVASTLIEPIKAELHLTDSSVAWLTGVALAIFYVTVGLPLSTIADRTNRRVLIACALGAWSVMTACCGLAQNFWQLMLARIGVGVGEAGGTPPSTSLICDYFPWRRRALALSVFAIGTSLGSMLGSSAGYASDAWGWRAAFLLLGIPGIVVAILIILTVPEPRRGRLDEAAATDRTGIWDVLRRVRHEPALVHVLMGSCLYTFWAWGLMFWTPSYLVRSHHMTLGDAGGSLALMHGIGGTSVLVLTTLVMGRLSRYDPRAIPWFLAVVIAVGTVPSVLAYSVDSTALAQHMLWIFVPLSYSVAGPTLAILQNLAPANERAQMMALLLFFSNIANLVIAPQLVGFAADMLTPRFGPNALRHALIPLAFTGFWAAWHYVMLAKHLIRGLAHATGSERPPK